MIRFELDNVHTGWKIVAVIGTPDDIYLSIETDEHGRVERYESLRHLVKLYECVRYGVSSDEHPVRGGIPVTVEDGTVRMSIDVPVDGPLFVERSSRRVRSALEPFLAAVFEALDSQSSDTERVESIEHMTLNYPFLTDFSDHYESLTGNTAE